MPKTYESPKIAAAYIRVSTDDQTDLSPETQLLELQRFAAREGYLIPEEYIFRDEGISGRKADRRPAFQRMIGTAKQSPPPFQTILVWKFSRFARNQEESIVYKSLLRRNAGVDVVSVTESIPDGIFGSLIERIIEWFDEFYSIRLSQEVKRSMTVKAQRGELQSTPSYGYRAENGVLVPEPEEAAHIREIFRLYTEEQVGMFAIARRMNEAGRRTHRGNSFENRTIHYILNNPTYLGKLRWNPAGRTRRNFDDPNIILAEGQHEALITQEQWDAAQRRLALEREKRPYHGRPSETLHAWPCGIVRCGACGHTLIFSAPHYMKCSAYAKGRCRSSQHIRAPLIEQAIIARLRQDLTSGLPLSAEVVYASADLLADDARRYQTAIAENERRMERLREAYLSGVESLDGYKAAKDRLEAEQARLQTQLQELSARDSADLSAVIREEISRVLTTLEDPSASVASKNEAARDIIQTATFDKSTMHLSLVYRKIF